MHLGIPNWFKSERRPQNPRINVLLVNDQPALRELVRRFLTVSGFGEFRFQEANDGAEAIRRFDPKTVDLVFVDHHVPGEDGIDLAVKMRKLSGSRHVPIVFSTSDGKVGVLEDAMDVAMADGFLLKPFSFEEFKHCVEPILSKRTLN